MRSKTKSLITHLPNFNGETKVLDKEIKMVKSIQNKWASVKHRIKYLPKMTQMNYKKQDHKV